MIPTIRYTALHTKPLQYLVNEIFRPNRASSGDQSKDCKCLDKLCDRRKKAIASQKKEKQLPSRRALAQEWPRGVKILLPAGQLALVFALPGSAD